MNLNDTIERAREVMRFQHKSWKTEKSYVGWIGRFARWCQRHPAGDHATKVRGFLTSIAADRGCAASTQSQALSALVFLYRHVLNEEVGDFSGFKPGRQPRRLPNVLSVPEVSALLSHLTGQHWLIAGLLYGAGLRLAEALSVRVKDVDFGRSIITVRDGKGAKDRSVMLPAAITEPLRHHIGLLTFLCKMARPESRAVAGGASGILQNSAALKTAQAALFTGGSALPHMPGS